MCTQEYGQHDAHRSPVMVYAPPADDGTPPSPPPRPSGWL